MTTPSRHEGDLHVAGALSCNTLQIPAGTVTKEDVKAAAGVEATKLEHQYQKNYSQKSDIAVVAGDYCIHTVYGATGTVVAFEAGLVTVPSGDKTVTVDLHKNGVTILSSAIVLDSANSAYTPEGGTISSASLVDGDVLEVVITIGGSTGTDPKGLFINTVVREDAQ